MLFRSVGETGGKDFIFVHPSAEGDLDAVVTAIVRGGFEYQGQKCSACSRVYAPQSMWPKLEAKLVAAINELKVGDVADFRNFMGAVIDEKSFNNTCSYLELAKGADAQIVAGGTADNKEGWFVRPTLVRCLTPRHRIMAEEIFAPVVGLYVYEDSQVLETLRECDQTAA